MKIKVGNSYLFFVLLIGCKINIIAVNQLALSPSSTQEIKPQQKKITNAISKKDVGYTYLFVKRYPDKFTVTVNNKELKSGDSTTIDGDTFEVGYSYEWWAPWQTYKGSGTKKYRIPAHINEVQVTFTDWHNPARIKVAKAELIEENTTFADTKKSDKKGKKRHGK